MTLVIVGLLLGFAGLVWVLVTDIVLSDRHCSTEAERPVKDPSAPESRAA